jgi:hypothetical protein
MRQAGKRILIIPEGWCEYDYAQSLKASLTRDKQRSIAVEIPKPSSATNAVQLLARANQMISRARRQRNSYDAVWLFFDNDNQPQLAAFFQQLAISTVHIAYSSICIEHWFILHFEDNRTAYANAHQALQRISILWQKHFKQDYHKTKVNHFEKLKDKLPLAIASANAIAKRAASDEIPEAQRNPYFTMPAFIQYFQAL